jgi:hypothetical protein
MTFRVIPLILILVGAAIAKPPLYRLWIVSRTGKISDTLADLFARRLQGVEVAVLDKSERYNKTPHYPMPVCEGEEYYLLGPGDELLRVGCIDQKFPTLAFPEISQALGAYETNTGKRSSPAVLAGRGRSGF